MTEDGETHRIYTDEDQQVSVLIAVGDREAAWTEAEEIEAEVGHRLWLVGAVILMRSASARVALRRERAAA